MSTGSTPPAEGMVRNTSWLLLGDIVAKIAGFVFVVLVARVVGREGYGYFTFGLSFASLLLLVGRWGLATAIQQEIARGGERVVEIRSSAFVFMAIVGTLVLTIVYSTSPLFVEGWEAFWAIVIVGVALLLDEFAVLNLAVFTALEKMRYPALVMMTNRIGSTLMTAIVLIFVDSIVWVCATYLIGSFGAYIGSTLLVRREMGPMRLSTVTKDSLVWQFHFGSSLGIASLLNAAVFRADTVMLQALQGPIAVGLYGAAYRFFESFLFVAWNMGTVLFPRAIRAGRTSEARAVYFRLASAMLSFYLPLAIGIHFVAGWLIVGIFSERYASSTDAVVLLMTAGLFFSFAYLSRMALIALERRRLIAWVAASTLTLNIAANLLLIPKYSFTGAATATLLSSIAEAAVLGFFFLRETPSGGAPRTLLVPIGAGAFMAAVLLLADLRDLSALLVSPVAYAAAWFAIASRVAPALTEEMGRLIRPSKRRSAG